MYVPVTPADLLFEPEPYVLEAHQFVRVRCIPWLRCVKCGQITQHNAFTEWCLAKGCNAADHPQYKRVRLQLTRRA